MSTGAVLWRGAVFRDLRERAYPIPSSQCHKTGECDEKTLQVQNREAETSDAAFDVALFQFALGLLGLGGLGFTVYYARQAWKEAERSAKAATDTLDHARASAAIQDRPYAFMDYRGFEQLSHLHPTLGKVVHSIRVRVTWKNMGQSPASRIIGCLSVDSFDKELPADFDFPDLIEPYALMPLGPGGTCSARYQIPLGDLGDTSTAKAFAYYWGWVEYDGLEPGLRHRTEVCARIFSGQAPGVPGALFEDTFHLTFNGFDGECRHQPKT